MKKYLISSLCGLCCLGLSGLVLADSCDNHTNGVSFTMQREAWATSDAAKVTVGFNGTMNAQELGPLHQKILDNLNKFSSKASWYITTFNRTQDSSGLERVYIRAEARVPENTLNDLRKTAKELSKPGATYEIEDIDFSPNLADIQTVKADLRQKLYEMAKDEIAHINQIYPNQHYELYNISFDETSPLPMMVSNEMVGFARRGDGMMSGGGGSTVSVSNKVIMTAKVELTPVSSNK